MASLVVYYSKTGNTAKVGQMIADELSADVEMIREEGTKRSGIIGWLLAGRDGFMGKTSKISETEKDPSTYDKVFIGSPVWGFNLAPAVRTYLKKYSLQGKNVALFCTMGGSGGKKLFSSMRELLPGAEVKAELAVKEIELKDEKALKEKIKTWVANTQ